MKTRIGAGLLVIFALACQPATAASTSELLQQGLYAEEVDGNIPEAIKIYERIASNRSAQPNQIAQALYREGMCHLKLKNEAAARVALERLVAEYPNETALVEKAKPVLEDITNFDPAALMPAGTLAYLELGSPGHQIETILNLLKGTPYENPLATMAPPGSKPGGGGNKSPDAILAALLNPSMLAEFKKIRSTAVGFTGLSENHPPFICVMYPGKSDALRGLIVAGLGVAGSPEPTLEGMQIFKLPEDMAAAYDDKAVIVARPASQLEWCIKQYKGKISEPTLASSNKSFAKLTKAQRQHNALTLWANADDVYSQVMAMFPKDKVPDRIQAANTLFDFANIDDFLLSHAIETDGLGNQAQLHFKDGHQCLAYDLIRTPNIRKAAFEAVPPNSVALVSFALAAGDSAQAERARAKVQNLTGLDVGREVFANIEQVTLFALALPGGDDVGSKEIIPTRLGLAITSRNPEQTRQLLTTLLQLASTMSGSAVSTPGRYRVAGGGKEPIDCYIDQFNGVTLLALNHDVIDASAAAMKNHKSILNSGSLSATVNKLAPTVSKVVIANVGGAMRLAGPNVAVKGANPEMLQQLNASFVEVAHALEPTVFQLCSDEQLNTFTVDSGVTSIPPLSKILEPARKLSNLNAQIQADATAQSLRQKTPATITPTASAPIIDGKVDSAWQNCAAYKLSHIFYDPLGSPDDLAAEYKTMWDSSNLYVLVDVTDDQLNHDLARDKWWQSDSVEVYIDADNAKAPQYGQNDYQYAFNWDKTAPTLIETKHSKTNGVEYAFAQTAKGYRVEIKFPWSTLGTKPTAGAKIGFDVHVNDNDGGGGRASKITWHDSKDDAHQNPSTFGNAELGGMVGWWKFDETDGTTVKDYSGGNHNGTVVGNAQWAKGKLAGAIQLDGARSFVRVANSQAFNMGGAMTIASWVNIHSIPSPWAAIVTKGDSAWRLSMVQQEPKFHFSFNNFDEKALANSATPVSLNQWHHVAAVYDGSKMKVFVDGQLDATGEWTGGIASNKADVLIGENAERKGRCFDGLVDDLRIYNYALPESQIKALAAGN